MRWTDRRVVVWVAVLVGVVVALGAAAGVGVRASYGAQVTADEPQYLLSALSLAEDGDLDIADELAAERWRDFHEANLPEQTRPLPDGRRLSPHNPLLPVLLAVPVALGGWAGAKLALAAVAGLLAGLLVWTATRRFGVPLPVAAVVMLVFGLSPPLAVFGTQVYPELPAALAVAVGVAALTGRAHAGYRPSAFRIRASESATGRLVTLAAAVVALPWLGVKYAPVAAALAAVAAVRLARRRAWRALGGLAAGLAVAGAAYAWAHLALYDGLTPYAVGDHFVGGELNVVGFSPNYPGRAVRLSGLLTDAKFGLAAWQPAWLLLLPAAAALARRRPPGWGALLAPLAAGWLTATFVALTMHGWWWPGRQVVVVLPVAVLTVAWWVGQWRVPGLLGGRPLGLLALGLILGLLGVLAYGWLVTDGLAGRLAWVVDFWETGNPVYQGWRWVLPEFLQPNGWTWPLHAGWTVALVALAVVGWRGAGRPERAAYPDHPDQEAPAGSAVTKS